MEIREFAEQVLFGRDLVQKLARPGKVSDHRPGPSVTAVDGPSRPPGLGFAPPGQRQSFPSVGQLDREEVRGQVLHFFANHELLALELMALALLRFPDAPPTFRKRLVATMRDEQEHLRLYIKRMGEFGIQFGEFGLNGYFWSTLSGMRRPVDFVSAMSLTFEQANLDFSLYFMKAFERVGDDDTASIMARVLKDEIAHVRHGVRYFEAWRCADVSQWDAYQAALTYPLTPARAKGPLFAENERLQAGLSVDFIHALKVYSHSKGRPPRVLLFNPDTDLCHHGSRKQKSPRVLLQLQRDLESLMMFLAKPDDVTLVNRRPSGPHLANLQASGYDLPEFVEVDLSSSSLNPMPQRGFETLQPWGWNTHLYKQCEQLIARCKRPTFASEDATRQATKHHSKAWAASHWQDWLEATPEELLPHIVDSPPVLIRCPQSLESALASLQEAGTEYIVAKAPFGAAGRQAIRIARTGVEPRQRQWIKRTLEDQGALVLEPWYRRVLDLSYLFEVGERAKAKELGLTRFITDDRGNYRGSYVGPAGSELPPELGAFFHRAAGQGWVLRACRAVASRFTRLAHAGGYRGPVGMDLMVISNSAGELMLRVPLEFNTRYTMGHISLAAGRPLGSRRRGIFYLFSEADLRAAGLADFSELNSRLERCAEVEVIPLSEAPRAERVWPALLSARQYGDVRRALRGMGIEVHG